MVNLSSGGTSKSDLECDFPPWIEKVASFSIEKLSLKEESKLEVGPIKVVAYILKNLGRLGPLGAKNAKPCRKMG
jgi:hypothetical protein